METDKAREFIEHYYDEEGVVPLTWDDIWKKVANYKPEEEIKELQEIIRNHEMGNADYKEFYESMSTQVNGSTLFDLLKARTRFSMEKYLGNIVQKNIIKKGDRVLDLGCSSGLEVCFYSQLVGPEGKSIGLDYSPGMISSAIERAKKRGVKNAHFVVGDIGGLPFKDNSFDVITTFHSLIEDECIRGWDSELCIAMAMRYRLEECQRALKPEGRIVISLPSAADMADYEINRVRNIASIVGFDDFHINKFPIKDSDGYGYTDLVVQAKRK
jgi:SAM-dependent methyltransferase